MREELKNQFKNLNKGTHIILIYKEKTEWSKAISSFIEASIENNEKIIYVSGEYSDKYIKDILKNNNVKIDKLIEKGQLSIFTKEQIYKDEFNIDDILRLLKNEAKKAHEENYESINITGEISWVLKHQNSFEKIIEYEKKVEEELFENYSIKALCRYNMEVFDESLIKRIIELHPYLVWRNRLYKNPYYISLDSFNSKNIYKKELKEWLNNIKYYQKEKDIYSKNLKEEKNKFKLLFDQVDDALFVHGISKKGFTNFEMVNKEACDILGYSKEELMSMSPIDIDSNKYNEEFYIDKHNKLLKNKHVKFESEHITKDGDMIPIENKSHLFDYNGRKLVLTVARDIRDRKKKDEIQKILLEEKAKFEFIFNEIKDALFIQGFTDDAYTKFKIVNQKACDLLGYKKEELLNKRPIDIISQSDIKKLKKGNRRDKLLDGKKIKFNIDLVTKNGNKIPVENNSHVFVYNDEKMVLTVSRDIREKLKKEKELNNQYNKIKEKNKRLSILNKRMNRLLSIITELSQYSIKDEEKFLKRLFRTSFEIIPQAELGSLYLYKDNKVIFLDTIGHNKEKLNLAEINVDNFNKYKKVVKISNINSDLDKRLANDKYIKFVEGSKNIAETLTFDINNNNEFIGGLSLDIEKDSKNKFNDISIKIFSAFKDIVESFYKIQSYDKLKGEFTKELTLSLIHILEFHDEYTIGHSENVAILASDFAEYLKLNEKEVSRIYWAGLVHDIGKILIPSYILNKAGKLTKQEYSIIKNHPKWAYETLIRSKQLSDIAKFVLYHHERWDGKGYPEGLLGENIPYLSQILSICDSWDAMRSNRSYRDALSYDEAINELKVNKQKQYSSVLVEKFINMLNIENNKIFSHK